jgi:hypothetical protein
LDEVHQYILVHFNGRNAMAAGFIDQNKNCYELGKSLDFPEMQTIYSLWRMRKTCAGLACLGSIYFGRWSVADGSFWVSARHIKEEEQRLSFSSAFKSWGPIGHRS